MIEGMGEYTRLAMYAVREAGMAIQAMVKADVNARPKGSNYDFVTDADCRAQDMIAKLIKRAYPHHRFLGEEDGMTDDEIARMIEGMGEDECLWIADPLDGTVNFIRDLSGYSVSLAMVKGGQVHVGAIYVPNDDELFCAERGQGAYLNGRAIHVSDCDTLGDALTTTGIPPVNMEYRREIAGRLSRVSMATMNLRIIGSAARAIACTAAGRFDGYWEIGPHPWDVAAGMLLVEEAGGVVTTLEGEPYRLGQPRILATTKALLAPLCDLLRQKEGE